MADEVRRDERSGRILADGRIGSMRSSDVSSEVSREAEARPDRPYPVDRILAVAAAVVVAAVVVVLVVTCALASDPGAAVVLGVVGVVVAVRPARRALALNRVVGTFVLVIDHQLVRGTTQRWRRPWNFSDTGHWVHLVDATTGRSLGWVELAPRSAARVVALGAAALFGSLSHRGAAVLVGPERNAQVVGRAFGDVPPPFYRERFRGRV